MNFVCIVFEFGNKMLTLSSMENLIVPCNQYCAPKVSFYGNRWGRIVMYIFGNSEIRNQLQIANSTSGSEINSYIHFKEISWLN